MLTSRRNISSNAISLRPETCHGPASPGLTARALLADGVVRVNGEAESRRGRRLHTADVVEVEGARIARTG